MLWFGRGERGGEGGKARHDRPVVLYVLIATKQDILLPSESCPHREGLSRSFEIGAAPFATLGSNMSQHLK